jgi:tetratricopeptide (TPR) repeat protein
MAINARVWLPILIVLAGLSATVSAPPGQYAVDGFTLADRNVSTNKNYKSYSCKPSDDFAEALRCERSEQLRSNGRNVTVSNTLIHTLDGTPIYVMSNAAPISHNRSGVQNEINAASHKIGERPAKVIWLPENSANPTAVIAVWGAVKLEELQGELLYGISEGKSPHLGVLVDSLGDLKQSADKGFPVYRITGGTGFVYAASFANGVGHQHYVAVDALQLATRQFQASVENALRRDQSLASNDYSLWPEVALAARRLALDTSPQEATAQLDKIFQNSPSKKLYSRVWPVLPLGPIQHLADDEYWPVDIYGPKTEHPNIRRELQRVISESPSDPFIEFAYYALGDFDNALRSKPSSVIGDAIHYARGHAVIESLLKDAVAAVNSRKKKDTDEPDGVIARLLYVNENGDIYDNKLLGSFVPNFGQRGAVAKPDLEAVLAHKTVHHADDAAYYLAWLAYQQGDSQEALRYLSQAVVVGNGDYQLAALRLTVRILLQKTPEEQFKIVDSDPNFAKQPVLWYVAARSAYRAYDYEATAREVRRALSVLDVPIDRLPATTDPKRLEVAIERINPDLNNDLNFVELPYLLQASKEFLDYETYLKSAATQPPDALATRARTIIVKYSMLLDPPEKPTAPLPLAHKDLRQAIHLIDATIGKVPTGRAYTSLRQWLYYRKVRISAVYAPQTVPAIVAVMEREFSSPKLLNNVLAEQLYAQGVMQHDVRAAEATFKTLIQKYPTGNAVDNAYGWMAILYRCVGRTQDALNMNREILRRFPLTRHAKYARDRMAHPGAENCGLDGFSSNT